MLANQYGNKFNRGISIIEILVIIAIISITLVNILDLTLISLKSSILIKETAEADALAVEMVEAVRNFRDGTEWSTGLGALTTGASNPYHPEKTGDTPPKWSIISGSETINQFTREVIFEEVARDGNDNIAESGTNDPDTRKVTVTISWKNREVEIVTYFTNWK